MSANHTSSTGAEHLEPLRINTELNARAIGSASLFAVTIGLAFPSDAALAQAVPQATPQLAPPARDQLVPPQIERRDRGVTLTIDGDLERTPCVLDRADYADIKLTLSGVDFRGLDRVPGLMLDEAYEGYIGRELPLSVMCDIRAKANSILRSQGFLATVEIPEQNLSDGVADFGVVFGRLTSVRVRGEAGPSEAVVAGYLEQLTSQDVFNTNDAERYLLLADDLPGVDVRLSLRPVAGGNPGDLLGEIAVVRRRGSLDFNVQNFGSESLGRFGGLFRGEVYDITGLGDRTTLSVFSTLELAEQQTYQLGHDFAVANDGLRIGAQLTYSEGNPDLDLAGFDLESETVLASIYAAYPLRRSRTVSAFLSGGFDLVDQDVELNDFPLSEDRVRTVFARMDTQWVDERSIQRLDGYTPFEPKWRAALGFEVRQGLDVFSTSPDCRSDLQICTAAGVVPPSRIEADPTPFVLRAEGSFEYRPDPWWTFSIDARAQVANDALPAFEEFAGGSFSIGRGYDPGAVLGDDGIGVSVEARYGSLAPQGPEEIAYQPYVFTDVMRVHNQDPSRDGTNPDGLWSVGGGLRAAWGSKLQADAFVAVPLERPEFAAERPDVRFMFSITARLFPWRF
ncbi:ShlB/FhaC/HecB family hemolysin secretion/activation protein [uncultured Erythrobacter sp.]|uniref:ShlB/FhaC/HecB family hemolysin secretion/activation protein n=1 Tax=uncultured Erythrobacter sp. TaxID=263913 RepID=UPI002637B513|nr:ShlB/FhaC/HecB family hemolysin secretion/activation protein [uncultured Erythrobacter sp.]